MNDLQTIDRLNAQAVDASIPAWRADGKWVVSTYSGVNFVGAEPFDTEGQARTKYNDLESHKYPDQRFQLLEPTAVPGENITGEVRPIAPQILGSSRSYAWVQVGDHEVPLEDLVAAAQAASAMDVAAWNELAEADRDGRVDAFIEQVRAGAPDSLAHFANAKAISAAA